MTTQVTALVPARAADDPRLSRTALRILLYLGNQVDNGGFVRLSIKQFMDVLGVEAELREVTATLSAHDARHYRETRVREVRVALHQLFHYRYIERKPRVVVDAMLQGIVKRQWWVRSLL